MFDCLGRALAEAWNSACFHSACIHAACAHAACAHAACAQHYFGGKHHGGWGLPTVKRGVGLFTHVFCVLIFVRIEAPWRVGASQCEERGGALRALFYVVIVLEGNTMRAGGFPM